MLRFHTQTAGSTLTAQQPEVNVVRTTIQALAAVLGGTQCLHTNSMDEALALPTENAARIALRTQQVIAHESGVADTVDPLAGLCDRRIDDGNRTARRRLHRKDRRAGRHAARDRNGLRSARDSGSGVRLSACGRNGRRDRRRRESISKRRDKPFKTLRVDPAIESDQIERCGPCVSGAMRRPPKMPWRDWKKPRGEPKMSCREFWIVSRRL